MHRAMVRSDFRNRVGDAIPVTVARPCRNCTGFRIHGEPAAAWVAARRLSIEAAAGNRVVPDVKGPAEAGPGYSSISVTGGLFGPDRDRKSTRLNSSHSQISYAVFC